MRCFPHELSGGMRQRVLIAAAFALEPKLVIADEPTTALDVTVQKQILRLIRSMQERHKTGAVFVTHDLGVVAQICDRVTLLYQGKVMEQGTTTDLLLNPQLPTPGPWCARRRATTGRRTASYRCPTASSPSADRRSPAMTGRPMPDLLSATDLVIGYSGGRTAFGRARPVVPVVKCVSLSIGRGEVIGIVGEVRLGQDNAGAGPCLA